MVELIACELTKGTARSDKTQIHRDVAISDRSKIKLQWCAITANITVYTIILLHLTPLRYICRKKIWTSYLKPDRYRYLLVFLADKGSACVLFARHKAHAWVQNTQHKLIGISKFIPMTMKSFNITWKYIIKLTFPTQFTHYMKGIYMIYINNSSSHRYLQLENEKCNS